MWDNARMAAKSRTASKKVGFHRLIDEFPAKHVLVVGDLVADHYIYGETERVSREAPVLIVRHESSEVKLGGAANAAANARGLGGKVTALGVLGRDEMGDTIRRLFKDAGITVAGVSSNQVPTETKTRILAGGSSTTRQQMLRLDRAIDGPLPPKVIAELGRSIQRAAQDVDAILVSDYGGGVIGEATRKVLEQLARDGMPICVDSRYALTSYRGFTLMKPNIPELEALVGHPVRTEGDLLYAGREAMRVMDCRSLIVTRGRHGMTIFNDDGDVEMIPVFGNEQAVDVTGAGDTVGAALTLGLATRARLTDAARIANVAGGLVVQKQGTAVIGSNEVRRALGLREA